MSESSPEAASAVEPSVVTAESTPAPIETTPTVESTPAGERESLIDAVEKALTPEEKGVDAASPAAENRSQKDEAKPQDTPPNGEPPDLTDEEKARLSPKTQSRIRFLAEERANLLQENERIKPLAERATQLDGFLRQNGISGDELSNTLALTGLIKAGRYEQAYEAMEPIFRELEKRAGRVLDVDLQEEVRLGHTPIERAKEVQALRARDASRSTADQVGQERAQQEAWGRYVDTVAKSADDWAKARASSDPDWSTKVDLVAEQVELVIRKEGFPQTTQDAIEIQERALKTVEERLRKFRPAPQSIQPNTGGGRSSAPKPAQPKSPLDAVNMALGD